MTASYAEPPETRGCLLRSPDPEAAAARAPEAAEEAAAAAAAAAGASVPRFFCAGIVALSFDRSHRQPAHAPVRSDILPYDVVSIVLLIIMRKPPQITRVDYQYTSVDVQTPPNLALCSSEEAVSGREGGAVENLNARLLVSPVV